jgi:Na+/H+-dicarboxylate symporter
MDPRSNGRISAMSFGYIVITNTIGAVIAIVVFLVIQPGTYMYMEFQGIYLEF